MGHAGTEEKNSSENYIVAEFDIKEEHLEEEQVIYNIVNNVVHHDENEENINREVRECEIEVDGEKIEFVQDYLFPRAGIYTIKYIFKSPLVDASSLFFYCPCMIKIDLSHFQGQKLKTVREMFSGGCEFLKSINLSNLELQNVTDMRSMFSACHSLESVDLSNLKAKNIENIDGLFASCASLVSVNLSNFNTEKVTDMSSLFSFCTSLKSVDLSSFNTKNVTTMKEMFNECSSLEYINLSNFDTSKVTDMEYLFGRCTSLKEIDLSNFNTQNVEKMGFMLSGCENLIKVNLSSFKIAKTTKLMGLFYQCSKLKKGGIITKEKRILEQYEKDTNEDE